MSSKVVMGYCTFPNQDVAERVCSLLVSEHLIACANIFQPIRSIYRWQGQICNEQECAVIFKTTALKQALLKERIRAEHPYEVPALVFWPVVDGWPDFLKWVYSETV